MVPFSIKAIGSEWISFLNVKFFKLKYPENTFKMENKIKAVIPVSVENCLSIMVLAINEPIETPIMKSKKFSCEISFVPIIRVKNRAKM